MKTILKNCFLMLTVISLTACSTDNENTSNGKTLSDSERQISLKGQLNMRDLGGYRNANGKIVRTEMLYRSGELSGLTEDDLQKVNALGIKQNVDLRTSTEILNRPDKYLNNTVAYQLPLLSDQFKSDWGYLTKIVIGQMTAEEFMLPLYTVDDQKTKSWKIFFSTLQTGTPTVFHCTTGKDCAGMTAALVLSALDVPRETIIKDFLLSNQYMAASIEKSVEGIDKYYGPGAGDKMRPVLGVERQYIEAFFSDIEAKYGTVDNFLTKVLEVDKNQMKKLYLN